MFWLSAKVEWFCPFQGRLFFLFKMYLSHEALNLKRLNLLDRDLYQKTLRDLSSKSGRKQTCLSIPQTMGEIQVWCSLVCSVFIFLHLLVVISSFLVSAATAVMGKNYTHVIPAACFTILSSPTESDQSAALLGNVLLPFSRSRVWGYACGSGDFTGKVYRWELLWEPRLSSSDMESTSFLWGSLLKPGSGKASSFSELLLLSCVLERSFLVLYNEEVLI